VEKDFKKRYSSRSWPILTKFVEFGKEGLLFRFIPIPATADLPSSSQRMPPTFLPSSIISLGHFNLNLFFSPTRVWITLMPAMRGNREWLGEIIER
jgi:hypothetical protein